MGLSDEYGRRLIPHIVDERALYEPNCPVYSVPVSPKDLSRGFKDISAQIFANAVNRVAWWLENELGKASEFPTIGYIGPHDIRYILLVLGSIKAGYKVLLISPRNSLEASLSVLKSSDCNIWILPDEQPTFLPQLLAARQMKTLKIDNVDKILDPKVVPVYKFSKTYENAAHEPFCVLHTSGSTGHPKPIIWKHSLLATLDASRLLPEASGRPPWVVLFDKGDRFYSAFPFFHAAGAIMNILIPALYDTCNVIGPVGVPSSVDLIDRLLDHANIKVWSIIPSIVDEIGENAAVHTKFRTSKIIIASGGPVSYESANKATESVRVMNLTGTSEGLFMGSLLTEQEDWIYFSFHPYVKFDFREIEPGIFEHYIVRDERYVSQYQGYFHTFPNISEMSLKDLYTAHPTKPGLWLYKGRTDDLVVLSTGEKIHPTDMEAIINRHSEVNASLIIGTGKYQAALLVELTNPEPTTVEARKDLLDRIFEQIQLANVSTSSHARIMKEFVIFAKPNKPFARTDKNTVKRRMTVLLYEEEIATFYSSIATGDSLKFSTDIDTTSLETASQGVYEVITTSLPSSMVLGPDDDLFHAGFDSLLAFRVVRCLRSAAEKSLINKEQLKTAFVPQLMYANPTLNRLSLAFFSLVHNSTESDRDLISLQSTKMRELLATYSADLPIRSRKQGEQFKESGTTIILTGSTGSLGSYLLENLIHQDHVKKIYCLNRAEGALKKQREIAHLRGLSTSWPTDKVQFLQTDLSKPSFGLEQHEFDELREQATHIIHNQWPVNFNYGISSFERHIQGVRQLIDFSIQSRHTASLFFVSTEATVNHIRDSGQVKETPVDILTTAYGGYGASKQVSELLLQEAWQTSGVAATICRVGQIAGPVLRAEKGMWAKQEWVPTIIASSKHLNMLPSTLGSKNRVDWIPVDILSNIIIELADISGVPSPFPNGIDKTNLFDNDETDACGEPPITTMPVYHAVNPEDSVWSDLVPIVLKHLGPAVKLVSWSDWVTALSQSQYSDSVLDLQANPGLKLLSTFESFERDAKNGQIPPLLATRRSETKSGTLAALKPVDSQWMEVWLRQWAF